MTISLDRLRQSRRRACRRLAAIQRAAALGGLSLAALGATPPPAPPTPAPAVDPPERKGLRPAPGPRLAPGDVRPATPAERAALATTPTFAAAVVDPFGLVDVGSQSAPAVGDLDGDGDLDVLAGASDGRLRYFENTAGAGATPTFATAVVDPFGLDDVGDRSTPSVADLDGDGDLDVLAGADDGTFRYFQNTGTPTAPAFAAAVVNPFGLTDVGGRSTPSVVDLDGDGDLDVLAGESGGDFRYFENTAGAGAAPVFLPEAIEPFGLFTLPSGSAVPSVADLDGDGDLDVLSGEGFGTFSYFENTAGAGNPLAFATAVEGPFGLAAVGAASTPSMGDFDGDGDLDVLAGASDGSFHYFENTQTPPPSGTPVFAAAQENPFGLIDGPYASRSMPVIVDIDGDGDLDVLTGDFVGKFYLLTNTAGPGTDPAFAAPVENPFGLSDVGFTSAPAVVDLDGDGDLDVLAGESDGPFNFFANTAGAGNTPAFGAPTLNPFGLSSLSSDSAPAVVDLDGDGDLDILAGDFQENVFYFENTAGAGNLPAFADPVADPFGITDLGVLLYALPSIVDLDGDGDQDIVIGSGNGNLYFFENTAAGGSPPAFAGGVVNPFGLIPESIRSAPAFADLDSDGDLDALVGSQGGPFFYYENTVRPLPLDVQLTGAAGWRFLGSPNPAATLAELLDDPLWVQGTTTGGDTDQGTPNVYRWDEGTRAYVPVTDLSETIGTGGVVMYVFSDDNGLDVAGDAGFPKDLDVTGPAPVAAGSRATFDVAGGNFDLSFTDDGDPGTMLDGFNLLAAPSASWFDWSGVDLTDANATVYVYDPAASSYKTYTQGVGEGTPGIAGGVLGPFQAFYVQAQAATASVGITPAVTNGGPLLGRTATPTVVGLSLRADAEHAASTLPEALEGGVTVAFGPAGASDGYGPEDAPALAPPTSPALSAWTEAAGADGSAVALAVDLRPDPAGEVEVPLVVSVAGATAGEPLVLRWPRFDGIPDDWSVRLVDRATGAEVDLRAETAYRFTASEDDVVSAEGRVDPLVPAPLAVPTRPGAARTDGSRFALVVTPEGAVSTEDGTLVDGVSLVRPNPASGRAEVAVTLAEAGPLRAAVYDALGREVAVLHDGPASGELRLSLDAGRLATGVYVVRVTGATLAESRTLTVVR